MRRSWQQIWWQHLGRGDLAVITVRDDDGCLKGLAPLFHVVENDEHNLYVIGCTEVTDYVDVIYRSDDGPVFLPALLEYLASSKDIVWDRLHLCNMIESSPTLRIVPEIGRSLGLQVDVTNEDVCPAIQLPSQYEAYLESLDKKQRHELRRKRRRAEENGTRWYLVGPEDDLDQEIEHFLVLMAMSNIEKANFLEMPGHRDFFKAVGKRLFDEGVLDLTFLTVENERAAVMWNYVYKGRMMLYNSGLNPVKFPAISPGIVLLTYNIEHSIASHCTIYDFLQGDEEYKFRMGASPIQVHSVQVTR
jgi:CelD/BcsL family acetyltransferase involved in cellulose biosynthesis